MLKDGRLIYTLGIVTGMIVFMVYDVTKPREFSGNIEKPIQAQVDFSMDDRLEALK